MADQPTDLPEWALTGTKTEPTSDRKNTGAESGYRIPFQYFNWVLNVCYQWANWLYEGLLRRSGLTTYTPVLSTSDRDGRARLTIDANGYMLGNAIHEQYRWGPRELSTSTVGDVLTVGDTMKLILQSGAVTADVSATDQGRSAPVLALHHTASTSTEAVISHDDNHTAPIGNLGDVVICAEVSMNLVDVDEHVDIFAGLTDFYPAGVFSTSLMLFSGTNVRCIGVHSVQNSTTFNVTTSDGTTRTNTSLGITPVDNTWYDVRIEYHGANTPKGVANSNAPVALIFINGTLTNTLTNDLPTTGYLGFAIGLDGSAAVNGSSHATYFSTAKLAWNDALAAHVVS